MVAGCGPIGLGMVAGARAKGSLDVIALDHIPAKLQLAAACGADITLDIGRDDPDAVVRALTDGYGADVYLDATGHPSAVPQGLNLLRKLGSLRRVRGVRLGRSPWTGPLISDVKELDVLGAHLGPYCWPTAIAMIEAGTTATGPDLQPPVAAPRTSAPASIWSAAARIR